MTENDRDELLAYLRLHSALGRIGLGEAREMLDKLEAGGWTVTRATPAKAA